MKTEVSDCNGRKSPTIFPFMEAELRTHLTALAVAYAEARKLEASTVARLSTGDWRFFTRMEEGASFTARKYDAIVAWFDANWPAGTAWPADIPRSPANSDTQEAAA